MGVVVVLWRSLTSDMQVDELQIPKLQAQVLITFNNNNNNNKMFNNVCFLLALCACDPLCVRACVRVLTFARDCVCFCHVLYQDVC